MDVDLTNFNTPNVIDIGMMFNGCSSLISIDLSNFNTQNIRKMNNLFQGMQIFDFN